MSYLLFNFNVNVCLSLNVKILQRDESFSKEEIEKILTDKDNWTTESGCVMEAAREYAAREYQDLLDEHSYDWEPEFTVEEE